MLENKALSKHRINQKRKLIKDIEQGYLQVDNGNKTILLTTDHKKSIIDDINREIDCIEKQQTQFYIESNKLVIDLENRNSDLNISIRNGELIKLKEYNRR